MNIKRIFTILVLSLTVVYSLTGCTTTNSAPKSDIVSVKNKKITIQAKDWNDDGTALEDTSYKGKYTGKLKKKKPYGKGTFVSKNSEGEKWTYKGEFKNGTFNGKGSTNWENEKNIEEAGTYTDGAFTPTKVEILKYENAYYKNSKISSFHNFYMSDKGMDFFINHQNYFPVDVNNVPADYAANIAGNFDYPQASKNMTGFEDKLFQVSDIEVVQNSENSLCGQTITEMLCVDDSLSFYYAVFYIGSTPFVEGDTINKMVFLPQCEGYFDDDTGGTTRCIFVVATEMS